MLQLSSHPGCRSSCVPRRVLPLLSNVVLLRYLLACVGVSLMLYSVACSPSLCPPSSPLGDRTDTERWCIWSPSFKTPHANNRAGSNQQVPRIRPCPSRSYPALLNPAALPLVFFPCWCARLSLRLRGAHDCHLQRHPELGGDDGRADRRNG